MVLDGDKHRQHQSQGAHSVMFSMTVRPGVGVSVPGKLEARLDPRGPQSLGCRSPLTTPLPPYSRLHLTFIPRLPAQTPIPRLGRSPGSFHEHWPGPARPRPGEAALPSLKSSARPTGRPPGARTPHPGRGAAPRPHCGGRSGRRSSGSASAWLQGAPPLPGGAPGLPPTRCAARAS